MLNDLRRWLEENMDIIWVAIGTTGVAGFYGFFISYIDSTPRNSIFCVVALASLAMGIVGFVIGGRVAFIREQKQNREDTARELREAGREQREIENHKLFKLERGEELSIADEKEKLDGSP